jgi:hypothetical protein
MKSRTSQLVTAGFAIVLVCRLSSAQNPLPTSPEEIAFAAVSEATNPAARVAAAEDFVTKFPSSAQRPKIAALVSEHLTILRNPEIAISLLDRARAIFTSPNEWEALKPAALAVYVSADRTDEAFALAADLLSRKPYEFWILSRLTYLGSREAKNRNLKYASVSQLYALRAIEIIEKDQRQSGLTDEAWAQSKAQLSGLYQQVAIIKLAEEKPSEAKMQLKKAIQLNALDPSNFALLGRLLNSEYENLAVRYEAMPEDSSKQRAKKKLESMIDEIIDAYAHATGLATGKAQYQLLLQQVIPDLTRVYRYRHNSTVGLQQLIESYKAPRVSDMR